MSETVWAVDGSFFAQRLSGIQRYSIELLAALDRIVPPGLVEIVTPPAMSFRCSAFGALRSYTMFATAPARTSIPIRAAG